MDRETLDQLSKDELITLVLAQAMQITALMEHIAALEAKLGQASPRALIPARNSTLLP